MKKELLIFKNDFETKIAYLEDKVLKNFFVENVYFNDIFGNVYYGRLDNQNTNLKYLFYDIGFKKKCFVKSTENKSNGEKSYIQVLFDDRKHSCFKGSKYIELESIYFKIILNKTGIIFDENICEKKKIIIENLIKSYDCKNFQIICKLNIGKMDIKTITLDFDYLLEKSLKLLKTEDSIELSLIEKINVIINFNEIDYLYIADNENTNNYCKSKINNYYLKNIQNIVVWNNKIELFEKYEVTKQLLNAYKKRIWLKTGINISIEITNSCTVIDVNSGKNIKSENSYEINKLAFLKIFEIIILRNISGMILIDFLNMKEIQRNLLLKDINDKLNYENKKIQIFGFTKLGFLEIAIENKNFFLDNYCLTMFNSKYNIELFRISEFFNKLYWFLDKKISNLKIIMQEDFASAINSDENFVKIIKKYEINNINLEIKINNDENISEKYNFIWS